jgi:hypothetical protein
MPISNPEINNRTYDYSSIALDIAGETFVAAKAINYSDSMEPGELRGTASLRLARTDGDYKAEGDLEMSLEEADALIQKLGDGFYQKSFNITVQYAQADKPVITDELIGCRLKKKANANSQGADPSMVKFDLDPFYIIHNGVKPFNAPNQSVRI